MEKLATRKMIVALLIGVFGLLSWRTVSAQSQNLLTNPGFEDPYSTVQGDPPRKVAQGWTPWHVPRTAAMPSFQNSQPEYQPTAPDTARVRNGSNAQLYFSFFATHIGGVLQRVTGITAGTEVRFSVYAYVWSTTFDDRNTSDQDGDVVVQVGIDPTGGTDGTSSNIVWSPGVEQYDAYREYAVIAKVPGSAVTVFVRSQVGFPIQNNNIYLDDAVLAATVAAPTVTDVVAPTNTNVPPTNTTVPPTNTTVPPTNTNVPPTNTNIPPTNTNVPPTNVPTNTNVPPTNIPTNTSVPPTLVPTVVPTQAGGATPTPEGILPTATVQSVPPTFTPQGSVPTATPLTVPTATSTPGGTGGVTTPISETFPSTLVHTVRRGDTVAKLAVLYGSTTEAIVQANGLDANALIFVGQGLVVPVRLPAPATSTPTATPVVIVVTATPGAPADGGTGGSNIYIVRPGDTLSNIAARYNTTVAAISQLNGIVNPNRIQAGQRLIIPGTGGNVGGAVPTSPPPPPAAVATPVATSVPPPAPPPANVQRTYVVQPGDTLYRISLKFGVSMRRLAELNGIVNVNTIYVGQVLTIP